jgi:hypothetical protein
MPGHCIIREILTPTVAGANNLLFNYENAVCQACQPELNKEIE